MLDDAGRIHSSRKNWRLTAYLQVSSERWLHVAGKVELDLRDCRKSRTKTY